MKPTSWSSIPRVVFRFARWGKSKKHVFNAIGRPTSTRFFALLGKSNPKWRYESDLIEFDPKGAFSFRPDGESRKNAFSTQLDDLRQPGFLRCLKKPTYQNAFARLSPSGRNEKTPLGSSSTRSVSYHHFGWAFPSSAKSRVHEGRPIAFKTRFFDLLDRGETKKHPWDRILQFRFHATILGGLFQAAQKAGLTKIVQLRS